MSTRRPPITPISTHGSVVWSPDNFPLANLADANPSSISIATCDPATCDVSSADLSSVFLAIRVPAGLPIGHVQVTNRPTYREYSFETATVWVNSASPEGADHLCGKITTHATQQVHTVWCNGAVGSYVSVKLETHNLPKYLWSTTGLHSLPYLALAAIAPYVYIPDLITTSPTLDAQSLGADSSEAPTQSPVNVIVGMAIGSVSVLLLLGIAIYFGYLYVPCLGRTRLEVRRIERPCKSTGSSSPSWVTALSPHPNVPEAPRGLVRSPSSLRRTLSAPASRSKLSTRSRTYPEPFNPTVGQPFDNIQATEDTASPDQHMHHGRALNPEHLYWIEMEVVAPPSAHALTARPGAATSECIPAFHPSPPERPQTLAPSPRKMRAQKVFEHASRHASRVTVPPRTITAGDEEATMAETSPSLRAQPALPEADEECIEVVAPAFDPQPNLRNTVAEAVSQSARLARQASPMDRSGEASDVSTEEEESVYYSGCDHSETSDDERCRV
jgi:hypothetical protein